LLLLDQAELIAVVVEQELVLLLLVESCLAALAKLVDCFALAVELDGEGSYVGVLLADCFP
jgi:hypothetical protein